MPATARIAAWEQLVSKAAGARAQSKQRPASSSGGGSAFSAASDFASTPTATNASTSGDQPPRPSSRGDEADADVTPLAQLAAGGAGDAPAVSVAANGSGGADVVMAAVLADAAMLATQPATGQTQALANLQVRVVERGGRMVRLLVRPRFACALARVAALLTAPPSSRLTLLPSQ